MKSIENINNESNDKLDSLFKTIQERAKLIKIEEVPDASEIIKEPYSLKRGAEEILIPASESNELLFRINQTYIFTAFSDDIDLINEVKKKLQLKENEDWFFDINKIIIEIKELSTNKKNKIDEYGIFKNIYNYILDKITALVINKYGGHKDNEPISVERVRTHKDKLNKAKKESRNIIVNKEVQDNENLLSFFDEIIDDETKDSFKKIQDFAKGNCEAQYFPEIYNDFIITSSNMKEGEKLLLVFDLFAMIIRDRHFYTEDEFNTSKLAHRNYNAYKKNVVKNILLLK
jgi:hypothetical protein